MMELVRLAEPDFLREKSKQWGQEYAEKKASNPKYEFRWKQFNLRSVRDLIVEALKPMSNNHCCYCDGGYPLGSSAQNTLDHFRPKSRPEFYKLVYSWTNLFIACNICQQHKGSKFDENLLKPDEATYQFETYFLINFNNGEIEVNPRASLDDQKRAEVTIDILGFNEDPRPHSRRTEYKKYQAASTANRDTDTYNYRFFLR